MSWTRGAARYKMKWLSWYDVSSWCCPGRGGEGLIRLRSFFCECYDICQGVKSRFDFTSHFTRNWFIGLRNCFHYGRNSVLSGSGIARCDCTINHDKIANFITVNHAMMIRSLKALWNHKHSVSCCCGCPSERLKDYTPSLTWKYPVAKLSFVGQCQSWAS